MRITFSNLFLPTILFYLIKTTINLPIVNITETIYSKNTYLSRTKDMEIWGNETIKWMDKMQENTILLNNLLVYTGGCDREICACPGTYASLQILNETLLFNSKWTSHKVNNFTFHELYIPRFNLEKHFKFDFSVEAFSLVRRKQFWTILVKQGEFHFKNPLYKKCSFTYEIFFPEEYLTNRRRELNEILHSFYNNNQARFAAEHAKEIERQKEKKVKNVI